MCNVDLLRLIPECTASHQLDPRSLASQGKQMEGWSYLENTGHANLLHQYDRNECKIGQL
jgi:hypothetical protein